MTDQKPAMTMREIREGLGHQLPPAEPEPSDEVRQLLVHPAVWPHLERWLAARNITLSRQQFDEDDLPTYVMTIRLAETLIGSITIPSESVQLDNGENLRDLAVGDSVDLRPDTGHEGLWIAAAFHGDYQDQITLQYAEVVEDCGSDPVIACKFSGTRHAHPVDLDGKVRPRPTP
jgi:hypothetical protein